MDTWSLDYYLLRVLPAALRDMKDCGYPAFGGYADQESWNKFLEGLAADLDSLKEDWSDTKNEYADEYHLYGRNNVELKENYKNRILELIKMQQQLAINTFTKIGEHLYDLWT